MKRTERYTRTKKMKILNTKTKKEAQNENWKYITRDPQIGERYKYKT